MSTVISYISNNATSVQKAFEQLMVVYNGDKAQVLTALNNNTIAVANADTWEAGLQETVVLIPEWALGLFAERGKQVTYNGVVYNIIQSHDINNPAFTPDVVPSLYRPAPVKAAGRIYPLWSSIGLLDGTNNWKLGDRVDHNGNYWSSDVNNNVWEPGVSQWTQI